MKNAKFLLINSLMLCSAYNTSSAMAGKPAAELLKNGLKKAFSGSMTSAHWAIAAGPSLTFGAFGTTYLLQEKDELRSMKCTDINPVVKAHLEQNSKHSIFLKSEKLDKTLPYQRTPNHIVIAPHIEAEIKNAIENNDFEDLKRWKNGFEIERKHIDYNHFHLVTGALLTMPFVTHVGSKAAHRHLFSTNLIKSFMGQQLIKMPTAIGKLGITTAAEYSLIKACEYLPSSPKKSKIKKA